MLHDKVGKNNHTIIGYLRNEIFAELDKVSSVKYPEEYDDWRDKTNRLVCLALDLLDQQDPNEKENQNENAL